MRNSHEISAALTERLALLNAETDAAKRSELASEVEALTRELQDAQLDEAARRALANQRALSPEERSEIRRFSLSKFLRQAAEGRMDGVEAEMDQEARKESNVEGYGIPSFLLRDIAANNATDTGVGKAFVAETKFDYIEALRNAVVATKAGAQHLTGLQGNVRLVKGGTFAGQWLAEGSAASMQKVDFSAVTLSPKRLQVLGGYTLDLLKQSALSVDDILWAELVASHAAALDDACFNGTGTSGQPKGILKTSGIGSIEMGTNGGPLDYAKLVGLETVVASKNGLRGSLAYVTNAKVFGAMKTTPMVEGYPAFLANGGQANGYNVYVTNSIPSNITKGSTTSKCSALAFGNWAELVIAQWGGLDFIVDPYTSKAKGIIEITAVAYHDIAVKNAESFAAIQDITTA